MEKALSSFIETLCSSGAFQFNSTKTTQHHMNALATAAATQYQRDSRVEKSRRRRLESRQEEENVEGDGANPRVG